MYAVLLDTFNLKGLNFDGLNCVQKWRKNQDENQIDNKNSEIIQRRNAEYMYY